MISEYTDIVRIQTELGYTSVKCSSVTTIQEIISVAMKSISLSASPQLYGLRILGLRDRNMLCNHVLCRHLTYSEVKKMYGNGDLQLTIYLFPTKFEEAARNDRATLFYLHQQTRNIYYSGLQNIKDVELAFEIGCLNIRNFITSSQLSVKEIIEAVEKVRDVSTFFPPCVLQNFKGKAFKKAVQSYLAKIIHYSEEDCALDLLNRYLVLLQFDRDIFKCRLGAGWGIPVDLIIGPRFQISIIVENGHQPRHLAYFVSIRQVIVTKVQIQGNECYQVKISMEQSTIAKGNNNNNNNQLDFISFTFTTPEEADAVVHLLEGYCGESLDDILSNGTLNAINNHELKWHMNSGITCSDFLPNGCPFRLCKTNKSQLQRLEINRNLITLEQVLGEGQFGDVYKGSYCRRPKLDTLLVAVKTCKLDASYEERKRFLEEAHILGEFDHPHIIKLFGVCSDEPIWLIMEYAALGELRHYLISKRNELTITQLLTYSYQIVTALACLESKKCVHRDIAARNILVSRPDCVKLADFGMSLILTDKNDFQAEQGRKMPIKWMAPESLHQRRFSSASDVWMFAVCIWEILSKGVKPFANLTNAEAVEQIARGVRLERPDKCPHGLYEILLQCWNVNPNLRPTFSMLKPRIRELTVQYKSTSSSEPVYLNCVDVHNQNDQSNRTYQNRLHINLTPPKPPRHYEMQTSKPSTNLQSRWDEANKIKWTKLNIPTGPYLSNNLEKSDKTIRNSLSPSRLVNFDLNSNSQRDTPSLNDISRSSPTRNASTSSVNSSTLGSVSSTVTLRGQSPDFRTPKQIPSSPAYHNTTKTFNLASDSRALTERKSDDFEKRCKSELRKKTSFYRKTMPAALPTQVIELNIDGNNNSSTSIESCSLISNKNKIRSFSSDGVRLANRQSTPILSRNTSLSQSISQHSSNQNNRLSNSPTRNIRISHHNNNPSISNVDKPVSSHSRHHRHASPSKRNNNNNNINNNNNNNMRHVDPVFAATVKVVKTVSLVSQQITTSKPEEYSSLIKTIGTSIKDLFSAIQNEFGDHVCDKILLAERQLNSSMYSLITTTKHAKLQNNRGPLLEEYRRHLMSLAYTIAADAHSLYTTIHENRIK
ncbi:unnamed protein product [Schistosoma turkestanicum]|nr:unnamed protein product [Schistosoma turkestanicum]